jgi:cell division protein FtsZ
VPVPGEAVAVIIIGLVVLLSLRLLTAVPGWAGRSRKPESRAIRVIGVGGGGSNAVDRMVRARIHAASFVVCNTDAQALRESSAATKIRIGDAITGGLGSGGDPEIGRRAAEEDEAKIARAVAGADLVFVTAGLGGGTGSGAAPIIAATARHHGALTIAVVTKPFGFEGSHRRRIAEAAAAELEANVDALIVVPNDRVADVLDEDASMVDAFGVVDDVLLQAVQGIIDLITAPGLINLDFADVRSVMKNAGPALIGLGRGRGEHRAADAARQAIASPLLEASIVGARGILFNVSGPSDLRLREVRIAAEAIREHADPEANVIFGASFSESLGEDVLITLIATGLTAHARSAMSPVPAAATEEPGLAVESAPVLSESPSVVAPAAVVAAAPDLAPAPVEAPVTAAETPPDPDTKRPSKRQARPAADVPALDAAPASAQHIRPRSAVGPDVPAQATQRSSRQDETDLDVPSFLRDRGRSTSGT